MADHIFTGCGAKAAGVFGCFLALVVSLVVPATVGPSDASASLQIECPGDLVPSDDGLSCQVVDDEPDSPSGIGCIDGQVLDETGLACIADPGPDSDDADDDSDGTEDPDADESEPDESPCDEGFELGADGETCVAVLAPCGSGKIRDDTGECVRSFTCPEGQILQSDRLSCSTSGCPEGQIISLDGQRCIAPEPRCPDGTLRPVGGACLEVVIDDAEGADSGEVTVRCATGDTYCQALVKRCAEDRAAGNLSDTDCADPRQSCDNDGTAIDDCEAQNARLLDCASRQDGDSDEGCEDLCPPLHELNGTGQCIEFLDPTHPCVSFGAVPASVTTNEQLNDYSFLAGTGQCVTRWEFLRRLGNFEAAAEAEADALAQLRSTTSSYLDLGRELDALDAELSLAEGSVTDLRDRAATADERRRLAEQRLDETRVLLEEEQERLKTEAVGFFIGGGDDAVAGAVLTASNLTEIRLAQAYGRALTRGQAQSVARISELERVNADLVAALESTISDVEQSLVQARARQADVVSLVASAEDLRSEQDALRDEEAQLVSDLRADKAVFAQQLGVFDQASREIADIVGESEFLVTQFAEFDGLFSHPLIPPDVSSGFGPRLHPILGYVRNHDGLDYSANFGDSIYAAAPGVVEVAAPFGGYGRTVVINHGEGNLTLYAHLSVIAAEPGETIERGDVIGFVGSSGLSTGPHLHFEIWVDGETAVDPLPYLPVED